VVTAIERAWKVSHLILDVLLVSFKMGSPSVIGEEAHLHLSEIDRVVISTQHITCFARFFIAGNAYAYGSFKKNRVSGML
jgi:hypothetical protein